MGIVLFSLFGDTPDRVVTRDDDKRRFIWEFRSRDMIGLEVHLFSDDETWVVKIYKVEWIGDEYSRYSNPIREESSEDIDRLLCYAEELVEEICNNSEDEMYPCSELFD